MISNCPYLYVYKKKSLEIDYQNNQVVRKIRLKFNCQTQTDKNWLNAASSIFSDRTRPLSNADKFPKPAKPMAIWYGSTTRLAVHRESTNPAKLYNLSNERLSYFSCIQWTVRTVTCVKVSKNKEARAY